MGDIDLPCSKQTEGRSVFLSLKVGVGSIVDACITGQHALTCSTTNADTVVSWYLSGRVMSGQLSMMTTCFDVYLTIALCNHCMLPTRKVFSIPSITLPIPIILLPLPSSPSKLKFMFVYLLGKSK